MFGRRTMLGLAVTKRSITVVEVVPTEGGGQGRRAAEFILPEALGLSEPVALGKALKQFLREQGFSASHCVIGLEANWLTAREKTLPPGAAGSIPAILSLMVEREFASDRQDLLFDYVLGPEAEGERSALLVAAPRQTVEQLRAMAKAAGLTVTGITASTIALAGSGDGAPARDHLILHLFGGGAEMALRRDGALRMMRRLPVSVSANPAAAEPSVNGWLGDLVDELRRVVAMLPEGTAETEVPELVIWNEMGIDEDACSVLSERLGLPVSFCGRIEGLVAEGAAPAARGGQFSAAAAMALSGLQRQGLAVDLCHSRLSPKTKLAVGRRAVWAAAVGAAFLVAGAVLLLDWRRDSLEVADLEVRLDGMAEDLVEAKATVAKVTAARPWYGYRSRYLDCMLEVTEAFPDAGDIWTTSLALREDMQVALSGKAVSESAVLKVLVDLERRPKISGVKLDYVRQAKRDSREVVFATSFTFTDLD